MKKSTWKKLLAVLLALVMVFALAACGGDTGGNESQNPGGADTQNPDNQGGGEDNSPADGGTIIWLSNLNAGAQYDAYVAYATDICAKLGYTFKVVYGSSMNDPAENLSAIQNGMTSDVVGIMVSEDGGVQNIVEEYPDLYVVGFNTDVRTVYGDDAAAPELVENDHWLGTIVDGYASGVKTGHDYAQAVINGGYKKVATIVFPFYAYPMLALGDATFREEIAAYNATAAAGDQIEVVGNAKMLEFVPLDESWFMEDGLNDLDAIVGFCDGLMPASNPLWPTACVRLTPSCSPPDSRTEMTLSRISAATA